MYDNKKELTYLMTAFIIIELIFSVIVASILSNVFTSDNITTNFAAQPEASITNLPASISEIDSKTIKNLLYSLILLNSETKTILDRDASAIIEHNSEYHFAGQQLTLLSATLRVPNLNQSYKLFYGYPDATNDSFQQFFELLCIEAPTTPCTSSSDSIELNIAQTFIPHLEFENFTTYFDQENPQEIRISPIIPLDDNSTANTTYIDEVKSALESLGLSPDLFTYHVLTPNDYTYIVKD